MPIILLIIAIVIAIVSTQLVLIPLTLVNLWHSFGLLWLIGGLLLVAWLLGDR